MKYTKPSAIAAVLILALTWQACQTFQNVKWEPEYLGPVVYTVIDPVEIANASSDTVLYDSEAEDLQITNFQYDQPIDVDTIDPMELPAKHEPLFDLFDTVRIIQGSMNIWFENTWPITIGAGTRIVGEDSLTGSIFDHTLPQDVPPGEFYQVTLPILNKSLRFGFTLQWRDFQSPGGNQVTFQSGNTLDLYYDFDLQEFSIAFVKPSKEYVLEDESQFELNIEDDSLLGEDPEGTLSFFIENNLPSDIELELKLLNSIGDTVYSFFGGQPVIIDAPAIGPDGRTQAPPSEVELIDAVDLADINQINDAAYLYTYTRFITPPNNLLVVDNDNYIRIQLTANVKVKGQ